MKEHGSYSLTTLMKHMKLFGGPELKGKKEKGRKRNILNNKKKKGKNLIETRQEGPVGNRPSTN